MCWRFAKPARAIVPALLAVGAVGACARPQGTLFEPIRPARVWPPPPETARIRLVGLLADSGDLKAARSAGEGFKAALRGPRPPIAFDGPHALAVHRKGLLAIADGAGACVHVMDLDGRTQARIAGWSEEDRFATPLGVAWAGERLFVTDAQRHEVVELDASGRFHRRFGGDDLVRPVGITYLRERNELYVVDGGAHCLVAFDLAGRKVRTIGGPGNACGSFNFPTHISNTGDRVLVSDSGNFRVQLLDLDGRCVRAIGRKGDGAGDFALPKGVAFDSEGHLYVVDAQFENIQIFNRDGRLLLAFGREGSGLGEFSLPAGLAIDEQDRIWVAESGNRRVQVFAYMGAEL